MKYLITITFNADKMTLCRVEANTVEDAVNRLLTNDTYINFADGEEPIGIKIEEEQDEDEEQVKMSRYILQESSECGWWVATDKERGIVVRFKERNYTSTAKITFLDDINPDALTIADYLRELGEWLAITHRNLL